MDQKVLNELVGRLETAVGIQDLRQRIEDAYANPSIELPFQRAELPEHAAAFVALYRAGAGNPEAYATFGYLMGRAETHARVLPLAISARSQGSSTAHRDRERSAAPTPRKWQAHADKVAHALGAPSPELS